MTHEEVSKKDALRKKWNELRISKNDISDWLGETKIGEEQLLVLENCLCMQRRNVFVTGSGGVGKSFIANKIIEFLRFIFDTSFPTKVALAASTGIAASHLGGTSIHSAAGIGVPKYNTDFHRMLGRKTRDLWLNLEVLFLDEVSMCSGMH